MFDRIISIIILSFIMISCRDSSVDLTQQKTKDYIALKTILGKEIKSIKDIDTLLFMYEEASNKEDKLKQMIICSRLSKLYRNRSDFSKSISYTLISLDIATLLKDTSEVILSYNGLGTNFRRLGAFSEAINYHRSALDFVNMLSDTTSFEAKKNKTITLNGIGNISLTLGYTEDAKRFFCEALNIEKSLKSYVGQAINYANIGSIYLKNNMFDSAMWYYNQSMLYNRLAKSDVGIVLSYANIGSVYEKQNNLIKAEEAYNKSYQGAYKIDDLWHKLSAYVSLGRVNIKLNNFAKAQKLLNNALEISQKIEASQIIIEIYHLFYEYYKKQGDYSKALYCFEQSEHFDNIVSNEQDKNRFMETRVNIERKQNKKKEEILKAKNKQQQLKTKYISVFGSIFICLLILTVLLFRRLQKAEKKRANMLNDMNNIKNKFFSIISHDLKHIATAINKSIKLFNTNLTDIPIEEQKKLLTELYNTSETQVELLDSLLNWSKVETGRMPFEPIRCNIKQLILQIKKQLSPLLKDKCINIKTTIPDNSYVEADFTMISIVIRNLLSNAIKFSYPNSTIEVIVSPEDNECLKISIIDSGIGMSKVDIDNCFQLDKSVPIKGTCGEQGTGLGLLVCREMLSKHKTALHIKSTQNKGSTFSFYLKKLS